MMLTRPIDEDYRPRIVNIGSISAYTSSTARGEYCISKAGLGMVTQLLADRLAAEGIPVFEVRPGIIATDMTETVHDKYQKLIVLETCEDPAWVKVRTDVIEGYVMARFITPVTGEQQEATPAPTPGFTPAPVE
jgi:NAD(P)-dependent dehydrogenase (short-subunit alcohol dehydrogenase family)